MLIGISTSGNTSGAYAFLRWCAASALVAAVLFGAIGVAEAVVRISVSEKKGTNPQEYNLTVSFPVPSWVTHNGSFSYFNVYLKPTSGSPLSCTDGSTPALFNTDGTTASSNGAYRFYFQFQTYDTPAAFSETLTSGDMTYYNTSFERNLSCVSSHGTPRGTVLEEGYVEVSVWASAGKVAGTVQPDRQIGSAVAVHVDVDRPTSPLKVEVIRDDRCAEWDAVEWVLAADSASEAATVKGTPAHHSEKTYCSGVSADHRFCLVPSAGAGDFAKTVSIRNAGGNDQHQSSSAVWGRPDGTSGSPAAPSISVYGDHEDMSSSSAVVVWPEVSGAWGYDVVYRVGGGSWWRAASCSLPHVSGDVNWVSCNGSTCFYRLHDLDPHASYSFAVRAHGAGGASAWSANKTLPVAAAASGLSATRHHPDYLQVNWTEDTSASPYPYRYHLTFSDGESNRSQSSCRTYGERIRSGVKLRRNGTDPYSSGRGECGVGFPDPHRSYRVSLRQAKADGDYAGRWSPWRNAGPVPPTSLPQVSGLKRFWNGAYQGRLGVRWNKLPGATGYHLTVARRKGGKHGPKSNHLVAMHHTGDWLMVTDWAKIQLCKGDWVRVGVRPLYEPDGKWVNDGSNTDQPDVAGPWRDTPESPYWTIMNKHDPVAGNVYEGRNCN